MKSRKTLIICLTVLVLTMTVFSGLSALAKDVEISWLIRTNPELEAWEKETIRQFEEEHPGIKVKMQVVPEEEMDLRLTTMLASGNVPDVWSTNWTMSGFATYKQMDALLDLTPYVERDPESIAGMDENALNTYTIDGRIYGIPMLSLDTYLFYNKDMLDEAGLPYPTTDWDDQSWTFDKLVEYAAALSKPEQRIYGFLDDDQPDRAAWHFGGDWYTPEAYETGFMGTPTVLRPENIYAVQWYQDMIDKGYVPSRATYEALGQIGDVFLTGNIGMIIRGSWALWIYQNADFNWGAGAIPWHEDRLIPTYTDPWNISKKSKHPDEAWEFVKFLTAKEKGARSFMLASKSTPVFADLLDEWAGEIAEMLEMTVEEVIQLRSGAQKYGKPYEGHLIAKRAIIYDHIRQGINAVQNGEIGVEEGLKEIQEALEHLDLY